MAAAIDFTDQTDAELETLLGKLEDKGELVAWLRSRVAEAKRAEDPTPARRRPRTIGGIRKVLLSDLQRFPAAFRTRLRARIEEMTAWGAEASAALVGVRAARMYSTYERFAYARGWTDTPPLRNCGCGCRGVNEEVAEAILNLRGAFAEYRDATTARKRTIWRLNVERQKTDLLEVLWISGQPRVDRRALEMHALEDTSDLLILRERELQWLLDEARYNRERLAHGRYLKSHGASRKGMPISQRTRTAFEAAAERAEEALPEVEVQAKRLRRLLEDRGECARAYTDCSRAEWGVFSIRARAELRWNRPTRAAAEVAHAAQ